jgi:hypothetical protein
MSTHVRWIALAVGVSVALVLVWITTLGIAVSSDIGGPCPMPTEEMDPGMTRQGWDWSEMGFVCVKTFQEDGREERYVVRWFMW